MIPYLWIRRKAK